MGNEQSTPGLGQQKKPLTKLTKPRTNTSTTNLLVNGSSNVSKQGSRIDLPMPPPSNQARTIPSEPVEIPERPKSSKTETKQKRRSLFRSKSAQTTHQVEEIDHERALEEWASPLHRYSTLGSITYDVVGEKQGTSDEQ
jgi:hypothetical protein